MDFARLRLAARGRGRPLAGLFKARKLIAMPPRVLVVDDEPGVQESLRMLLKHECEVQTVGSVDDALRALAESPPDVILLDLVMPGRSGFDLFAALAQQAAAPPVIVLSGTKTVATAVEAMKRGAADYVTKPFEVEALRIKVRQLLSRRELEREVEQLRARVAGQERLEGLLGRSAAMQEIFQTVRRVAASNVTVLIRGESGTGKELVARAIHALGPRRGGPFVAVNCAGIPEGLIESELFGHERGAFTDAVERRIGRFEAASGGTLFLDEIGELSPPVQAKLLRALQERRVERLGGSSSVPVDVRVLAATHRDLERDVADGRFRADLFYRIHVVPIELPPLRRRREDIALLAGHFLARARGAGAPARLAPDALAALERYAWPGNVRELENAIEHAIALAEGDQIAVDDLPGALVRATRIDGLHAALRSGELGFEEATAEFERELLLEALEGAGWNQTRAAEALRMTRRALKLRMDRLGLEPPAR
jgi:DNA-binding NtrC family response regulator